MYCQECGQRVSDGAKFCQSCGKKIKQIEIIQPSLQDETVSPSSQKVQLTDLQFNKKQIVQYKENGDPKIGGWLYVVGYSLATGCVYTLFNLVSYIPLLSNNMLSGTKLFNFVVIEFLFYLFIIFYNIFVFKLFFKRKIIFIKHFLWLLFLPVVFTCFECLILYLTNFDTHMFNKILNDSIGPVFCKMLFGSIFGVYLNQSKRVEQTFIR